ncbi:LipA and NB-ARC domain-containing protein [Seiridium cupressi]
MQSSSMTYSIEAASKISQSGTPRSDDANMLLVFLAFLAPSEKINVDLLSRGAAPRKRYTATGEIQVVGADQMGLNGDLSTFMSDSLRLNDAFYELKQLSVILEDNAGGYTLDRSAATFVQELLSPAHAIAWRFQALFIAYGAIPWKYIDAP